MRNLTIKRAKRFVACLAAMKVYIEDPAGDTVILDTPCRLLGTLKNGEENTFSIDTAELKVFVIAGPVSKNFCNDFCRIPAGEEDVFLSGRNEFNPATGNAFRFDGVPDADALLNRQKGNQKGQTVLIVSIIVGVVLGIGVAGAIFTSVFIQALKTHPKTFTYEEMSITLTDKFKKTYLDDGTLCYDSSDISVFVLKDADLDEYDIFTLDDYTDALMVMDFGDTPSAKIRNADGLTYIEYTYSDPENNEVYHYFAHVYQSGNDFWMLTFAIYESDLVKYQPQILDYAKSVEFSD